VGTNDSSSVVFVGEVPNQKEARWVTIETTAARTGQDAVLRWRAAASSDGGAIPRLCLYVQTLEKPTLIPAAGEAQNGHPPVKEISIGSRDERAALSLGVPLQAAPEAAGDRNRALFAAPGGEIEVAISAGSRHEATLAREHVKRAEELYRSGQPGAAMEALARTRELYPEQKGEVARAAERLEVWNKSATDALDALRADMAVLRDTSAPVVKDILLERAGLFKARYAGTPHAEEATRLIADVESFWAGLAAKRTAREIDSLLEKAKKHFDAHELGLAELHARAVAEGDASGERAREATRLLERIKKLRESDKAVRLLQ
jgi:hypothetical protein